MSINFQMALNGPVAWADLLQAVQSAATDLLRIRDTRLPSVHEWSKGTTTRVAGGCLTFAAPCSVFLFSLDPKVLIKRCVELHLFRADDGEGPCASPLPDEAEVTTGNGSQFWPEYLALMCAVTVGLARCSNAAIRYAPWSGGQSWSGLDGSAIPGPWSPDSFVRLVGTSGEPTDLEAAHGRLAFNVCTLIRLPWSTPVRRPRRQRRPVL